MLLAFFFFFGLGVDLFLIHVAGEPELSAGKLNCNTRRLAGYFY